MAACLFKLMDDRDNCCCIFKCTRRVRPATWRLRLGVNVLKNTHFNGDFIWWVSVKIRNWGENASAKELKREHPVRCKRDPQRERDHTRVIKWGVNSLTGWFLPLILTSSTLAYCRIIPLSTSSPTAPCKRKRKKKRGKGCFILQLICCKHIAQLLTMN